MNLHRLADIKSKRRALIGGPSRVRSHFGIRTICVKCNKRIWRRRAIMTALPIAILLAFIAYEQLGSDVSYPVSETTNSSSRP